MDNNIYRYFDNMPVIYSEKDCFLKLSYQIKPPNELNNIIDLNSIVSNELLNLGDCKNLLNDPALLSPYFNVISITGMTGSTKTTIVSKLIECLDYKYLKTNVLLPQLTMKNLYNIDVFRVISYMNVQNYVKKNQWYIQDRTSYDNLIFYFVHFLMLHDIMDPMLCTLDHLSFLKILFNKFLINTGLDKTFRYTHGHNDNIKYLVLVSRDTDIVSSSMYNRYSTTSATDKINAINKKYLWGQFYAYVLFSKYFNWPIYDISTLVNEENYTMHTLHNLITETLLQAKHNKNYNTCVPYGIDTTLISLNAYENKNKIYTIDELKSLMFDNDDDNGSDDDSSSISSSSKEVIENVNGQKRKYEADNMNEADRKQDEAEQAEIQNIRRQLQLEKIVKANEMELINEKKFFDFQDKYLSRKYNISMLQMYYNHLDFSKK